MTASLPLRLLPLLLLACAEPENPSAVLTRALRAAEAGDSGAWELCEQLDEGEGAGMCKVAASAAMPDRGAACEKIVRGHWRGECWFEYAEVHAKAARWEGAIAACREAEAYEKDCARHIWWVAQLGGAPDPALRTRLATAFGVEEAYIARGAEEYRAAAEAAAAGEQRERAQREAEAARVEEEERRLAETMAAVAQDPWKRRFDAESRIDSTTCPEDEREACVAAARTEFTARWERAVERSDAARRHLCGEEGNVGRRLLPYDHDVELLAAMDGLRPRLCATTPAPG